MNNERFGCREIFFYVRDLAMRDNDITWEHSDNSEQNKHTHDSLRGKLPAFGASSSPIPHSPSPIFQQKNKEL
jgi:hypothetical protein